ncbi:MAG: glucose-6-phosphate dehydrogenase [Candidatus Babeliales bacterium]
MNNYLVIIFGGSGDLAKRKLIPALYKLWVHNKVTQLCMVAVASDDTTAETILNEARTFITDELLKEQDWADFVSRFFYQRLHFEELNDFFTLKQYVESLEKTFNLSGNRMFYIATASQFFCLITEALAKSKLACSADKWESYWHYIVYEKPFGHDEQSAREINSCIARFFLESQIYRIDHYLTKELVSSISLLRFTNCVLEPLWNNHYIDHVQIILSETNSIGTRGRYYDHFGALKDVVQNHMLELLALVAMEPPELLTGEYIRKKRLQVLQKVRVQDVLLGQYKGYTEEKYVDPSSQTETYALLALSVENFRWKGVPFYMKTGKCLDRRETVIHIVFKQVDCLLAHCPQDPNSLTIRINPKGEISWRVNVKKIGATDAVMPVDMVFCHSCLFGDSTPESYEVIFEEIAKGEQAVSVRFDEIECAWNIIDPLNQYRNEMVIYEQGVTGPSEEQNFLKKHSFKWLT